MRDNMKYITRIYHVNKHTKDIFKDVSGYGNHIMLLYSDVSVYILKLMPSGQITPSITFYNVYKLSLMPSRQMTPNITFNKSKKPHSRFRN